MICPYSNENKCKRTHNQVDIIFCHLHHSNRSLSFSVPKGTQNLLRFEVLTVLSIKIVVLWDVNHAFWSLLSTTPYNCKSHKIMGVTMTTTLLLLFLMNSHNVNLSSSLTTTTCFCYFHHFCYTFSRRRVWVPIFTRVSSRTTYSSNW
jgi:hypothetical protein